MHTIRLYGELAKFGDSFSFEVQTPHEMIRALTSQIKELGRIIKKGQFRIVRGESVQNGYEYENFKKDKKYIFLDMILGETPQTLHLIPVLAGSKSGGLGKIFLGAVLMVGAVIAAPFTGGTSLMAGVSGFTFGVGGGFAFSLGASIFAGGLASALAPTAKPQSFEKADEKPSYFMSGPINMASEGGALAVAVGEFIVGTTVINASLESVDIL